MQLVVGADGKAGDIECAPNLSAPICRAMTLTVQSWQFEPGQRSGQADAMAVSLGLDVVPVPVDGGFRMQVNHATLNVAPAPTTPAEAMSKAPPAYPLDELRRNRQAVVIVEWWFARDAEAGHLGKAWRDGREARKGDPFVAAVANAVRQWPEPPHVAEQLSYCVRMDFSTGPSPSPFAGSPMDTGNCQATYAAGFAPPRLLTPLAVAQ